MRGSRSRISSPGRSARGLHPGYNQTMFTLSDIETALPVVRAAVPATPQYAWPLLKAATGVEVVVKHENHTPIGAFKVRGGLVYAERLKRVPKAWEKAFEVNPSESEAVRASCVEFVLAGLYASDRISRSQKHGRITYEIR